MLVSTSNAVSLHLSQPCEKCSRNHSLCCFSSALKYLHNLAKEVFGYPGDEAAAQGEAGGDISSTEPGLNTQQRSVKGSKGMMEISFHSSVVSACSPDVSKFLCLSICNFSFNVIQ